jgi:hypothetical protein
VAEEVGRSDADCRDRYRNHLRHRDTRRKGVQSLFDLQPTRLCLQSSTIQGRWSEDEEGELERAVKELKVEQNIANDATIPWGEVSERMGNSRGRQQCAAKWYRLSNLSVFQAPTVIWSYVLGRS